MRRAGLCVVTGNDDCASWARNGQLWGVHGGTFEQRVPTDA
jgi:hypothetical protein